MSTTTTTISSPRHGDTAPTTLALKPASPTPKDASPTRPDEPTHLFVRPYDPDPDRDGTERVFRHVYTPLYRFAGLTTIAFIVFCRAYLDLSPETCYVLVDEHHTGGSVPRVLGYIVSAPDTQAFCNALAKNQGSCRSDIEAIPAAPRAEEMRDPELRGRCMEYFRQRNAWVSVIGSGLSGIEELVFSGSAKKELEGKYDAHFHMALAPEVQGRGWGRRLVGAFEEGVRRLGVKGMFAAVPAENGSARKLYGRCGFEGLKGRNGKEIGVLGGGEGEMEGKVLMVKRLE